MKVISIFFIGEDILSALSHSSEGYQNNVASQEQSNLAPLGNLIKSSISDSKPAPINLPKYDDSAVERILRYAAPNLGNDDYYPEKTVNPIIGSASNKTLGTFPLFSSAFLAPAGLWDKRRRAIGDYMLELEKSKQRPQDLNYEFKPEEGASPWMKAYNDNAIEDLHDLEVQGRQQGISMKDAGKLGHPANEQVNTTINNLKSGLKTVTDIEKTIGDISTKNLNLDNHIGERAAKAIELYKHLSSLPENNVVEFGGVKYQGKKGLARSKDFQDAMYELSQDLSVDNDLLSMADNRAKQIQSKALEEAKVTGNTDNYMEILKKKLESKYPLYGKTNPITGEPEMSPTTYLEDIALQTAKSRPSLFKETARSPDDAPYTLKDLRDVLRSNLGYSASEDIYIANKGGGGSATNTVNAAPQYVKGTLEKLNRGEVVQGKTGKSSIIPGDTYTTYIVNGQMRIIPNGNTVENAKAIAEAGGADNEYGSVDAPTAIVQMNTGADADKTYKEFNNARPAESGKRFEVDPNASTQEKFNSALNSFSKENGAPIAGGTDILISRMKSRDADKSDKNFFFQLKNSSSNVQTQGVVIPKEKAEASVTNPDASGWQSFWGNDQVKMFVPKGQDAIMIDGAYYHKNEGGKDNVSSYTIYDKKTNSPLQFPGKSKFDPTYTVQVPEYYVKNILSTPERLVAEANKNYKEDKSTPNATQQTTISDTKTKTGGKGQTMTVENPPASAETKEQRAIKYFKSQGYSEQDAVKFVNIYKTSNDATKKKKWENF